jgi:hypothetical protein
VVNLSLVRPLAILRRKGLDFRGFLFLVEARDRKENYSLFNRHHVIDNEMRPLYCRVIHQGHAVLGGTPSVIFTPVALIGF